MGQFVRFTFFKILLETGKVGPASFPLFTFACCKPAGNNRSQSYLFVHKNTFVVAELLQPDQPEGAGGGALAHTVPVRWSPAHRQSCADAVVAPPPSPTRARCLYNTHPPPLTAC